jgi:hypothetical protein
LFSSEVSFTQEMLLWDEMIDNEANASAPAGDGVPSVTPTPAGV